jgi:myosin-crossreactive antigen
MTAASSFGSMTSPPRLERGDRGASWALWEALAVKHPEFGHPEAFTRNIDESKWLLFTVTLNDPVFFDLMEAFTGNAAGTGGLVTFVDSSWLMSVVLAYQPHFIGQPRGIQMFWGYGLFVDQEGDFVKKKMSDCTGEELLIELLGHLGFDAQKDAILGAANCIPCIMPFITSQFMPRAQGDRPDVRPLVRPISPLSDNIAKSRTMSSSPSSIRCARRKSRFIRCWSCRPLSRRSIRASSICLYRFVRRRRCSAHNRRSRAERRPRLRAGRRTIARRSVMPEHRARLDHTTIEDPTHRGQAAG